MPREAAPTGPRGRQPDHGDAAIQTCPPMAVPCGMPRRPRPGFVGSLRGWPDRAVRAFGTLSRRPKTLKVDVPHRGSPGPLHLPVDGTGIEAESVGEWHPRRHNGSKRLVWRRIHVGGDTSGEDRETVQ